MANEITVNCGVTIRKLGTGNAVVQDYQSRPTSARITLTGSKGPAPGAITATIGGTFIDLSAFTTPGICWMMNMDPENFVTIGLYDGTDFRPFIDLLPGIPTVVYLSRYLTDEFLGTGTVVTASPVRLMALADRASCIVKVEIFER